MFWLVSWTKQENHSFSLLRREIHGAHVEVQFANLVSVVNPGVAVLSDITSWVLGDFNLPGEVWWRVLLLFLDFLFASKLIIKWISLLLTKPIWNLSVCHVLDFHLAWHHTKLSEWHLVDCWLSS